MLVQVITPPASEPITLGEAKAQLTLEGALDDTLVTALITAAREFVEKTYWRGLVTQTLELVLDSFPDDGDLSAERQGIELPLGALASVTSVKYIDSAGAEQTMTAVTDYVVDTVSVPGRVRLAYGKSWPPPREQWDAVRVRYVVGTAVGAVPQSIKQALLLLVSDMYERRTPEVMEIPAVKALMGPYDLARGL